MSESGEKKDVTTARAPRPVGAYVHAKRVGDLLFLSGLGPRDPATNQVPGNVYDAEGRLVGHDVRAQCHAVFRNVRTVLEEAGAAWEDIVDVTVFLTDMETDFAAYNEVYAEYFSATRPTRTTVGVSALPTPIAIELKVIAEVRQGKQQ
jgi:2-aminomuconate deaminase